MVEDDVHCLNVDGMGLNAVHEADVARFSNLRELSANDNMLPFRPLGKLPQIKSLSLACNSILELGNLAGRFEHLEVGLNERKKNSMWIDVRNTFPHHPYRPSTYPSTVSAVPRLIYSQHYQSCACST